MAIILPSGQWYAPSAVINDAWYCMILHGIAWHCIEEPPRVMRDAKLLREKLIIYIRKRKGRLAFNRLPSGLTRTSQGHEGAPSLTELPHLAFALAKLVPQNTKPRPSHKPFRL